MSADDRGGKPKHVTDGMYDLYPVNLYKGSLNGSALWPDKVVFQMREVYSFPAYQTY
jgi:hypothetical protein